MSVKPIIYSVCGTIKKINESSVYHVSGIIQVDPTLRLWSGSAVSPSAPAPTNLQDDQYSYYIPGYSLFIYTLEQPRAVYSFLGTAGCLYIERTQQNIGDRMWFLEKGSGDLMKCFGEHFHGYNDDLSDYDLFNELAVLPSFIKLNDLQSDPNEPLLSQLESGEVLLTMIERDQVCQSTE